MALIISSHGMYSAQVTANAGQSSDNLTNPLPLLKLISEDILVNIFSRLEEDPRHLARLACVCRIFAHVVRNVCWKRQCIRIVPDIMPSPHAHLDQIPEPLGGWGALMKLLVCCPGLKHAGIVPGCWDFGLERELGPTELYEVNPPKRRVQVDNVPAATYGDASASQSGNRELKAASGDTTASAPLVFVNSKFVTGTSSNQVRKPAWSGGIDKYFRKYVGDGAFKAGTWDTPVTPVRGNAELEDLPNGFTRKCSIRDAEVENPVTMMEVENGKSLGKKTEAVVDAGMQGTGSGESKAVNGDSSVQSVMEVSNDSVLDSQKGAAGGSDVGMPAVKESDGRSTLVATFSKVNVQCGSGRPPRKPVRRVHWKEEELAAKANKDGSQVTELVTDMDRRRSKKRKERALRRLLAKAHEDPKQRLHVVRAEWTTPREEGSRLLANRFRGDSLYICDWPGCSHVGEKRNYKLFRGFFKNFKMSLMWRNLKDTNARKTNSSCAFCSSTTTWDLMSAFCLRSSFEYHDDGEPVVHASVCENGHVAGAWTDRPGVCAAL